MKKQQSINSFRIQLSTPVIQRPTSWHIIPPDVIDAAVECYCSHCHSITV